MAAEKGLCGAGQMLVTQESVNFTTTHSLQRTAVLKLVSYSSVMLSLQAAIPSDDRELFLWVFTDCVWEMEGGSDNDGHYAGHELGCCVYLLARTPHPLVCLW